MDREFELLARAPVSLFPGFGWPELPLDRFCQSHSPGILVLELFESDAVFDAGNGGIWRFGVMRADRHDADVFVDACEAFSTAA